ncbi:hypothetical protein ACWIUD_10885 [Helicobacter sp. 23-1044]
MTNLLKMCALGLLAFGLVACDEVSQKVNEVADSAGKAIDSATTEGKKIAKALSIEAPLLTIDFDKDYDPYFVIQSQDNNTIIEDIILNRGNCGVVKYKEDYDMAKAYRELNGNKLKTKNGQLVEMSGGILSSDFYNSLDEDSKAVYKKTFPIKLPYAKKLAMKDFRLDDRGIIACRTNDIIEIEVIVNGGGSYIFKPKEMMLF